MRKAAALTATTFLALLVNSVELDPNSGESLRLAQQTSARLDTWNSLRERSAVDEKLTSP